MEERLITKDDNGLRKINGGDGWGYLGREEIITKRLQLRKKKSFDGIGGPYKSTCYPMGYKVIR